MVSNQNQTISNASCLTPDPDNSADELNAQQLAKDNQV